MVNNANDKSPAKDASGAKIKRATEEGDEGRRMAVRGITGS